MYRGDIRSLTYSPLHLTSRSQYGMYQTAQGGDRSLAIAPFNNLRQHYCLVCAREGGNREAAQVVKLLAAALLYALDLPAEALPPLFSDVKGEFLPWTGDMPFRLLIHTSVSRCPTTHHIRASAGLCAQFGADSKWRDGVISKLIERLGQEGAKAVAQARKEIEEGLAAMAGKQGSGGVKNAGKGTNEAAMRVVEEKALSLDERVVAATSLVLCVPQKSLGLLHNICLIVLATVQVRMDPRLPRLDTELPLYHS